jgi:hypothetical protein
MSVLRSSNFVAASAQGRASTGTMWFVIDKCVLELRRFIYQCWEYSGLPVDACALRGPNGEPWMKSHILAGADGKTNVPWLGRYGSRD